MYSCIKLDPSKWMGYRPPRLIITAVWNFVYFISFIIRLERQDDLRMTKSIVQCHFQRKDDQMRLPISCLISVIQGRSVSKWSQDDKIHRPVSFPKEGWSNEITKSHASSLSSKVVRYPNDLRMTKYPRSVVVLGCTNGWGGRRQDDSGMARTNTEWLYWLEWTMNDIQTQSAPSLNVTLDLLRRRSHGFIFIIWSRSTVVLTILFPRTTLEWHLISFHYHCVHTFIGPFQHAPD